MEVQHVPCPNPVQVDPSVPQLACAAVVMTMLETAATAAPRPSCPAIWRRVLPVRMSGGRAIFSASRFDLFSRCSASQTARSSSPCVDDVGHGRRTVATAPDLRGKFVQAGRGMATHIVDQRFVVDLAHDQMCGLGFRHRIRRHGYPLGYEYGGKHNITGRASLK